MTDRRRLLLVRHGVTDWNREGRFQGHLDPPLAEDGRMEAELLAARLAADDHLRPGRIISSTLARAWQTAEPIGTRAGVVVEPDARLIEIGQGDWEGRTHDDLAASDADRYDAWRRDAGIRQPPGGEAIESATERVRALLSDLEAEDGRWPLCIVSHGGTLRILARLLLDAGGDASWSFDVDNASLGVCSSTDTGWRLDRWNDTLHLLGTTPTHIDEAEGRPLAL
ncbi:MAG: histidine phosphatase family protein [Chloroflexota bacterium]